MSIQSSHKVFFYFIKLKYFISTIVVTFFAFDFSAATDPLLTVYDNTQTGRKTYVINEHLHPDKTGISELNGAGGSSNPKVPMFHPYADWAPFTETSVGMGIPQVPLVIHFSSDYLVGDVHPMLHPILSRMKEAGINNEDAQVCLVAQTMPWKDIPILFRPHYSMFPNAPRVGIENIYVPVTTGLFYSDSNTLSLDDTPINQFRSSRVVIHPDTHSDPDTVPSAPSFLVLSENTLCVQNLNREAQQSVLSYVDYIEPGTTTRKALITLHWLLNDEQADFLESLFQSKDSGSIPEAEIDSMIRTIEEHPSFYHKNGAVEKLKLLLRESE